jgi:hypothetical protein
MLIKQFKYVYDQTNKHYLYYIQDPNNNIVFDADDNDDFFNYLTQQNCSAQINKDYIMNTHKMKESVLVLVIDNSEAQDFRAIKGFCYLKKLTQEDFLNSHNLFNKGVERVVDEKLDAFLSAVNAIMQIVDNILKYNQLRLSDIYENDRKKNVFMMKIRTILAEVVYKNSVNIYHMCENIVNVISNKDYTYLLDLYSRFSPLKSHLYISAICSNRKKAGHILDNLTSLTYQQQNDYLGFQYQILSLNGIDSAYSYYVKKGFKRSLDGVLYFPEGEEHVEYFDGEYDGYLFTKRVDIPKDLLFIM